MSAATPLQPAAGGWQARLRLGFQVRGGRTVLAERERRGPLAVQRPFYPEAGVCHVYLLHPPGGVVGGDSLRIDSASAARAESLVTTPGATKFYRSGGALAQQHQLLSLADGAALEWLPQENIFFPGARAALHTRIDLAADARLAWWEIHCLGRPVIGEAFDRGCVDATTEIWRDGVPLLCDRLRVTPERRGRLSLLAGRPVSATLVMGPVDAEGLATSRRLLPQSGADYTGATLIDGLLVVRYLGGATAAVRRLFAALWQALRPTVIGRPPVPPRIWAT